MNKWTWWSVPNESRIYRINNENWSYYGQFHRRFYFNDESETYPLNFAIPISVTPVAASFSIEGVVAVFDILPSNNSLFEFENDYVWSNLQESFDKAIKDPTILLDKLVLPENMCQALSDGIQNGTANIVFDGSFNPASPFGPVGMSAVILVPSTKCLPRHWTKGCNWVTGPAAL